MITQDGRGNFAASGGQTIAMRAGDLASQAVGTQEPKQAGDPCRSAMLFGGVTASLGIEMDGQVPIAEALQDVLASTDDRQELLIDRRPRLQRTHRPAFPTGGATDRSHPLLDGDGTVQRGQGLQVAVVDPWTDLRPALGIGHPFAEVAPLPGSLRIAFLRTVRFEAIGIVPRGLDP